MNVLFYYAVSTNPFNAFCWIVWLIVSSLSCHQMTNTFYSYAFYYYTGYKFFTSVLLGGLSLESEWQQVSSGLQDSSEYRVKRWNYRPRKDDMISLPFYENRFSFFLFFFLSFFFFFVGQLCTNPKSDRSLLSCLKVTKCSTSEIGDAQLYNSFSLPIQVMTTGPLPAPSKWKSGLPRITGTCPGWGKQSFRLRL